MNKRIFYIFFTNLFFLVILYFSLEFIVYSSFLSNDAGRSKKLFEKVGFFSNTLLSPIENFEIAIKNASEGTPVSRRIQFPNDIPIVNKNNKGSIILYGCSYTWGWVYRKTRYYLIYFNIKQILKYTIGQFLGMVFSICCIN